MLADLGLKMPYLIDTNILIYSLKNSGNVNKKFQEKQNTDMSISVVSYGELVFGAEKSQYREKNMRTVQSISEIFPIENITADIMECFGKLKAQLQKSGKVIDDMDLLIASTAISRNMILVTHNSKHFIEIPNLTIEDWF